MRHLVATLVLLAAACTASDDDGPPIDAPVIDAVPGTDALVVPPGPHNGFVISSLNLPRNAAEAQQLGLDLDDRANDGIDNQLGMVLGSLTTLSPGLDMQAFQDRELARGDIVYLHGLRGPSIASGPLELSTYQGANPVPAPCAGANDTQCGRHLQGTASFTVAASGSPTPLVGQHDGVVYRGATGVAVLPLIGDGWLPLQGAKAELRTLSAAGYVGKLGGAVSETDVRFVLVPAFAVLVRDVFDQDCDVGGSPPACGCDPGGDGESMRGLFDKAPNDCAITDAEVVAVMSDFFTPDIDSDGDGTNDALSIGVGITAVAAQFTP